MGDKHGNVVRANSNYGWGRAGKEIMNMGKNLDFIWWTR